jgi:hypothetical protein
MHLVGSAERSAYIVEFGAQPKRLASSTNCTDLEVRKHTHDSKIHRLMADKLTCHH